MEETFKILGFARSLRKGSYNKALLRTALDIVPKGADLEIFDLEGIPQFNQDLENEPVEKQAQITIEHIDDLVNYELASSLDDDKLEDKRT